MSSQIGDKGVHKRHRPYLQSLKAVETQAALLQHSLQQEQQRQQDIVEHNLVLSEVIFTQGKLQEIYEQQQQWKLHNFDSADRVQGPLAASRAEPNTLQDAHWVVHLLEIATPQQLQQAVSMTCEDWNSYQREYCSELMKLVEADKRCPEVQAILLGGWQAVLSAQAPLPAAYTCKRVVSPVQLPSAVLPVEDQQEPSSLASEAIIHLLKTTGTLMYIALLHGLPAVFQAAACNLHTGVEQQAPDVHWAEVALRMHFSRQQKLHFRLAIQNFKRQMQDLGQQGLSILQETPSYAFLLACQNIIARQAGSEDTLSQSAVPSLSADPSSGSMSKQSSSNAGSAMERLQLGTASPAGGSAESPGAADLAAQGPGGGVAAGSGECASAGDVSMSIGYEDQEVQAVMDLVEPSLASKELQSTVSLYYRLLININIFLADTLTLEQALLLNVASYPFWPMLLDIAEAALQLPEEQEEVGEQCGIQQLMRHRRSCMQRTHYEWFGDYGKPEAAGE